MSSIALLVDELYREEVARARATDPVEKLFEGPRLFDRSCRLMADGIRHQYPDLDQAGVDALLAARLQLSERLNARDR